ncbi:uncharacterized protein [Periplaneta americana]|uniref:uncharacterized protein n=1 Tax=Periplaneta americana TaxID=6978 RepID=UPI0037E76E92
MTSAERGSLITIVLCMSAGGTYVPAMFIFPRKNFSPLLMKGAPPGSIADCHPSGWIQTDLFKKWFLHFVEKVKPTREDPALLIFDGHYSHTRNLQLIDCARENNVTLICLPPHSTHKLQPLDRSFIGPLKSYYSEEVRTFLRSQGRPVSHFDVAELLARAYLKASSVENAVSGFKVTGIYPLNPNIFRDWEFATNEHSGTSTTNTVEEIPESVAPSSSQNQTTSKPGTSTENFVASPTNISPVRRINRPSTSQNKTSSKPSTSTESAISPMDISPVPVLNKPSTSQRGRKKGTACVVTSSPYKAQVEASLRSKEKSNSKSIAKIRSTISRKRQLFPTSEDGNLSDSNESVNVHQSRSKDINEPEDDAVCIFCAGKFSDDARGEEWIQCTLCESWAHSACSDTENLDFICDYCK